MPVPMSKVLFYSKCRPGNTNAWEVARQHRRVFVGYPVDLKGPPKEERERWRELGTRRFLLDVSQPESQWSPPAVSWKAQVTRNRSLALEIGPGSIALVPRPAEGLCWAAEVTGPFELLDRPGELANTYLAERGRQRVVSNADELTVVSDVVQTWPVNDWTSLPFAGIPRWISYRLLSRQTADIIRHTRETPESPLDAVRELMNRPEGQRYSRCLLPENSSLEDVERALQDWVTPTVFEHVVVELLQLDAKPGVYWHHIGGSGDGGVDGIAVDPEGKLMGVLQCKRYSTENPGRIAAELKRRLDVSDIYVAFLAGNQSAPAGNTDFHFLNRAEIAKRFRAHVASLPLALSIGLRPQHEK